MRALTLLNIAGCLAIPASFAVHFGLGKSTSNASLEPVATFFLAALGVVPLAGVMGLATEHLAEQAGPTWGGLLNATFGNAAELIIGVIALTKGLTDVVRATLTGSIIGNLLLVGGAAMLAGGWNREKQVFNRHSAQTNAGLLTLAVASMLLPAIFDFSWRASPQFETAVLRRHEQALSVGTSVVLLTVYALGLLFTLRTHRHVFSRSPAHRADSAPDAGAGSRWTGKRSVGALFLASVVVAALSELLVGSVEQMAQRLNWNPIFVGIILLSIVGNAAEHSTAVIMARRNDMDTALAIAHQSSLQIALFVTPALVLLSTVMAALGAIPGGHQSAGAGPHAPLSLVFSPLETAAVAVSVATVAVLGLDGETNWLEGAMLLALYAILGLAFFYMP